MSVILCECAECNGDYGEWESYDSVAYRIFSVKEWLCQDCFDEFVFGESE